MQIVYEEEGSIKVATVLTEAAASLQVESPHGKRSKIKASAVLLRFNRPEIAQFMPEAEQKAEEIDLDFLWECANPEEFSFTVLAQEYYGRNPDPVELTSVLLKLHSAPMYFYKKGKGKYKAAPPESLKAALASLEKKRLQAQAKEAYMAALAEFVLPPAFTPLLDMLIYKPDRNTLEYKALSEAAALHKLSPVALLEKCGALPSTAEYHLKKFMLEDYPATLTQRLDDAPLIIPELPISEVCAFSIDDFSTTEIDDAFSVTRVASGNWRIGIHIAAPALAINPASPLDNYAGQRLSTVYMPGDKITMLPQNVIELFSLNEETVRPTLSMYLEVTPEYEIVAVESSLEQIRVAANLRHAQLAVLFNEAAVAAAHTDYPFGEELHVLWHLAEKLRQLRGKENLTHFKEYDFSFDAGRIQITERMRDTPIDKVVSELMIYANSTWAEKLSQAGVAAIYRVQENGKTRMDNTPGVHSGLGVSSYAWCTSPLRRYIDLVNQRQLIALLQQAPPPYKKGDTEFLAILRNFDIAYDVYNEFQRRMERYWCLRYLIQEQITEVRASVIRENLVRFTDLPLITRVNDLLGQEAGSDVELTITRIDLLELLVECRYHKPALHSLAATGT